MHHQGWRWSKEQCEIVYLINIKLLKQGTMWNPVFDKRQIVGLKILRNSQEKWTILASSLAVVQSAKINIWWAAATQNLDPKPEQACPKPGSYLNKHVQNLEPTWTSISEERREVKIQEYLDAASGSPDSRSTRTWRKMIKNPPKTGFKQLLRKNLQVAPMDVSDHCIHLMLFGNLDD